MKKVGVLTTKIDIKCRFCAFRTTYYSYLADHIFDLHRLEYQAIQAKISAVIEKENQAEEVITGKNPQFNDYEFNDLEDDLVDEGRETSIDFCLKRM